MVAQGRVRNGVVVLDDSVHLPEGEVVTVFAPSPAAGLAAAQLARHPACQSWLRPAAPDSRR